jgi:hypothetical protein
MLHAPMCKGYQQLPRSKTPFAAELIVVMSHSMMLFDQVCVLLALLV